MLIISDYKDFYDTAIGYGGIDKSVVYKRKTVEINNSNIYSEEYKKYFSFFDEIRNFDKRGYDYFLSYNNLFNVSFRALVVCGELYPFVDFHIITYGYTTKKKNYYFYDFNSLKEFVTKRFLKKMKKIKYRDPKEFFKEIESFFNHFNNVDKTKVINYHVDVNSPIVFYKKNQILLNAKLSDYDFYKVIDAFQMYQKLEMFLSGVMVKDEKKIIQLDDKSLRDKKGFNDMSFKKEKEK